MENRKSFSPLKLSLTTQTFLAMGLGILVGLLFGNRLAFLGEVSRVVVYVIKTLAIPLLFLTITEGFLRAEFKGRGFVTLLLVSFLNAACAVSIALLISNAFHPGQYLSLKLPEDSPFLSQTSWLHKMGSSIPGGSATSLITGTSLVILLSLVFGSSLLILRKTVLRNKIQFFEGLTQLIEKGLKLLFLLIDWVVLFLPLAVFCAVVKVVGSHGFSLAKGLLAYFLACAAGMTLHILVVYQSWIRWAGKMTLKYFWKIALEPALYAFGINSSLATLPVTLKTLSKLKVSPSSARLSACVGTNFNNDGILLYEVVAALFLIQAYGISLPLQAQMGVALVSVIACIGVAGIPEAGIISLTIVLSSIGLPSEAIPFLLTIDWVLARMRSFTNVLGDISVAVAIDRFTSQGRFAEKPKLLE